ncbi:MAG: hypothetical protein R2684_14610 [Pyrinomonadaceae bacterium]
MELGTLPGRPWNSSELMLANVVKLRDFAELQKRESLPSGVRAFDLATGGLVRGGISEFVGRAGSGKRSLVSAFLASLTRQNHICAVVDSTDSFDPVSAEASGIRLSKILWVKCGGDPEKAVLATDYLIQSRLFGGIWLDMSLCEKSFLDRMPNSYWFRFKVGLKDSPGVLLVTLEEPRLRSAAHQSVVINKEDCEWRGDSNFRVMRDRNIGLETIRPRQRNATVQIQG